MQGGREQQRLVHIRRSKTLSHGRILSPNTLWKSCHVWCLGGIYSDSPLVLLCYKNWRRQQGHLGRERAKWVAISKLLLQFLVVALDAPPQLRRGHQFPQADRRRQVGQPVFRRLLLGLGPFEQQPLFWARLAALVVPMRHAHPPGRKAGMHRAARAFAPTHPAQVAWAQTQG